jgi:hypothetical protein
MLTSMKIPDEALDEFTRLYKDEFNEDITKAQASEMAFRLVTLYELLGQKLPEEHITPPGDPPREPMGFQLQ